MYLSDCVYHTRVFSGKLKKQETLSFGGKKIHALSLNGVTYDK